jgi:ATP-binding cassette subfamily B protein
VLHRAIAILRLVLGSGHARREQVQGRWDADAMEPLWRVHRNDTGPSALALIASFYGIPLDLHRARGLCGTTTRGTNLAGLRDGFEKVGFAVKAAKAPHCDVLESAFTKTGPLVAHVEVELDDGGGPYRTGQFVVVRSMDDEIEFIETAVGPRRLSRDEFEDMWTGNILLVVPTPRCFA